MTSTNALRGILAAVILAVAFGGCSAINALNPLKRKEEIMPGERTPALPQTVSEVTGGTPSIGAASALAEWPQPGGNAANAPGNVSLDGASGAASWRVRAVDKASKRNVRPSVPPLVFGGRIFVYDTSGTVTSMSPGGGKAW
jgi:outer membrane protein assembly factor BamB